MGDFTRRDFIVKGGKYAIFTASAMQVLFTSKRAMAQSGIVRFVIRVYSNHHPSRRGTFSPMIARSPSATWHGSTQDVRYHYYSIEFEGDIDQLPDNVPITISWTNNGFNRRFAWGFPNLNSNPTHITIPKTGATIGRFGDFEPHGNHRNRPQAWTRNNSATGDVTFTAPGVQPLVLTIVYP